MEKVSLPKGTRDFGPTQMAKRQFIIESIKSVFQNYGFQPLETPAMENLSTLTGKYGDEGDKLLFKILNSGPGSIDDFKSLFKLKEMVNQGSIKSHLKNIIVDFFENFYDKIKNQNLIQTTDSSYLLYRDTIISELILFKEIYFKKYPNEQVGYLQVKDLIQNDRSFIAEKLGETLFKSLGKTFFTENIEKKYFDSENFDFFKEIFRDASNDISNYPEISIISEKGLRYDLTVPFARYVVMNRHEIAFPFKRYQIQPVWRADRPQKGRYREFYQCDADVVGTDSLVCEAEIILMIKDAFKALGIKDYSVKINHRAILSGLAQILKAEGNESALFVAIDKLDKLGEEKVKEELALKGFDESSLSLLFDILNFKGNTKQKIDFLTQKFMNSEKGKKGLSDFTEVLALLKKFGANEDHVEFDISLARGLSYYTGCIFEVKINKVGIGSVSGGGRYDNLTAVFDSKEKSSGVGFSFGIDRIYDAMEELQIFPENATASSMALVAHLDEESFTYGLKIVQSLRENGIASEIYPDQTKIKKQLEYADKKKIPFVIVIGSEEMKTGLLTLKKMQSGEQLKLSFQEIISNVSIR